MVIPVLNEGKIIEQTISEAVVAFSTMLPTLDWMLVVADNGSIDDTAQIVQRFMAHEPRLRLWQTRQRGKGRAVRGAWSAHEADVYAFMDADLSADMACLPRLLEALEHTPIAVGSRLARESQRRRSWRGEIVSMSYITLRKLMIDLPVRDSQCGFKALRREAWEQLKDDLRHDGWFFDTEMLAFAHRAGLAITEVPIRWVEARYPGRKSKIGVWQSAMESLGHLWDLRQRLKFGIDDQPPID